MCVIIVRQPGITIPFEKLESACHVNGDGFGIVFNDRGKQEVIKEYDPKGNNAQRIFKRLEDTKDFHVALHLRYKTAGEKSVLNCHPFQSLTRKDNGIDIQFMHNGTLTKFSDSKSEFSDSYHFNQKIVTPLLLRSAALFGPDECLTDPLVHDILEEYRGWSKFVLFDSNDKILIVGRSDGKEYDGYWASNDYSFNRTHRKPTSYKPTFWGYSASKNDNQNTDTEKDYTEENFDLMYGKKKEASSTLREESDQLSKVFKELRDAGADFTEIEPPQVRETFIQLCDLDTLEEVCRLEPDDIEELVQNYPEMAKILILDLLYELYMKNEDQTTN